MTRSNSARAEKQRPVLTLGFCIDPAGEAQLLASGVPSELIWRRGDNVVSLDSCLTCFRGRPGVLAVVDDLRIFGESRKAIIAQQRALKARGIVVLDVVANDNDELSLLDRALIAISSAAGMRNHRTARRRGRVGGIAKGIAAAIERENDVPAWLIRKIVNHPLLTWAIIKDLIGDVASISTLRRRYVDQP